MLRSAFIVIEEINGKKVVRYANQQFLETFGDYIRIDPDDRMEDEQKPQHVTTRTMVEEFINTLDENENLDVRTEKFERLAQKPVFIDLFGIDAP